MSSSNYNNPADCDAPEAPGDLRLEVHPDAKDTPEGNAVTQGDEMAALRAALRRSEARLAQAQRIGQVGSWEYDLAQHSLHCSSEMLHLFA